MFIESLVIRKNGKTGCIIRKIKFHKGVNLIIDESSSDQITETGNNVGKTTVLRLIDFCLGGKKANIYQDSEFTGRNEKSNNVKIFLEENQVYIELVLINNSNNQNIKKIVIGRNFLSYKEKIQEIDGDQFNNENDFLNKLGELIFHSQLKKPSFRQIICRNIRHQTNALNNTLKPLHQATSNIEYQEIYLYWLGISSDSSSKIELTRKIESEKGYYKKIENSQGDNLNTIKQKIIAYQDKIVQLNRKREKFNLNKNYNKDLEQLNQTKKSINELKTLIISLNMKKNLVFESQKELDKITPRVEENKVRLIYSEAKMLLPDLQKRFEDILVFHHNMIEEKKRFIGKELPQIEHQLNIYKKQKEDLLSEESHLSKKLQKTGAIEELEKLIQQLTKQHEEKGRLEKIREILESSEDKMEKWKGELNIINQQLDSMKENIVNRITLFNRYFSEISMSLYGKAFLVSHQFIENKEQSTFKLIITGLEENPGTGGKRGEIVAFDLAYIQFAEELEIPHVNFVLHDQIENIHDNQITNILLNIVQEIDCQYIIPVLRDKLPSGIDLGKYSVLSLSQNDKLFQLP